MHFMVSLRLSSLKLNTTRFLSPFMQEIVVTKEEVIELTGLNPSKALGPDEIILEPLKN